MARRRFVVLGLLLAVSLVGQAAEQPPTHHLLTHFNAGQGVSLTVGERFTVQLERPANGETVWIWLYLPEEIVRAASPEPQRRAAGNAVVEEWTFVAVALGAAEMTAELVAADDFTDVRARFPFGVQVVE